METKPNAAIISKSLNNIEIEPLKSNEEKKSLIQKTQTNKFFCC